MSYNATNILLRVLSMANAFFEHFALQILSDFKVHFLYTFIQGTLLSYFFPPKRQADSCFRIFFSVYKLSVNDLLRTIWKSNFSTSSYLQLLYSYVSQCNSFCNHLTTNIIFGIGLNLARHISIIKSLPWPHLYGVICIAGNPNIQL